MQSCLSEIILIVNVCDVAVLQSPLNNGQSSSGSTQKHQVVPLVVCNMMCSLISKPILIWSSMHYDLINLSNHGPPVQS